MAPGGRRPSRSRHSEDRPCEPGPEPSWEERSQLMAGARATARRLGWPAGLQDRGPRLNLVPAWRRPLRPQLTQLHLEQPPPSPTARGAFCARKVPGPGYRPPEEVNLPQAPRSRTPSLRPHSPRCSASVLLGRQAWLTCFHRDRLLVRGGHLGHILEGGGILQGGTKVRGQDPRPTPLARDLLLPWPSWTQRPQRLCRDPSL